MHWNFLLAAMNLGYHAANRLQFVIGSGQICNPRYYHFRDRRRSPLRSFMGVLSISVKDIIATRVDRRLAAQGRDRLDSRACYYHDQDDNLRHSGAF